MTARTTVTGVAAGAITTLAGLVGAFAAPTGATAAADDQRVCHALPTDLRLIAASPTTGVVAASATGEEALQMELPAPPTVAGRGPDGTTWVQVAARYAENGELGFGQVLAVGPGGATTLVLDSPDGRLFDVGWADDRAGALLVDYAYDDASDGDEWGSAYLAFADGTLRPIGPAGGPEYGVAALSLGNGTIAEGAWSDLTETFTFRDLAGNRREGFFNPAYGAPYNDVPLWLWPALSDPVSSADPLLLSWVEGPDYPADTNWESPELVGGWTVSVADALAGTTFHRVELPIPPTLGLHQASFDGRFWVGSFSARAGVIDTLASYAIDFAADAPSPVDLQCLADAAVTIDRADAATPTPILPTGAAAPTPPSSGGCDGVYADAGDGELPIRRCTRGLPVEVVQTLLVRAGYDVDPDGYFGPATTATVLQFQRYHGLEADALVGPLTWAQLLDAAGLDAGDLTHDSNGNGRLDPGDRALLTAGGG